MPRYVILEHDHPVLHWDLMLEDNGALRTWRLNEPPQIGREVAATFLARHRLLYLDYEGPVSGNRGSVTRRDAGSFTWQTDETCLVVVHLRGERLQGTVTLKQIRGDEWAVSLLS